MADDRKIYQVSEITRRVRVTLEEAIGNIWIEGEISNLRKPSSGHLYFTLKDDRAQISAVLFRGNQRGLRFAPKDGLLVRAHGEITVYERGGNYQVIVRTLEVSGKGALQEQFDKLKKSLEKERLFDPDRKKPLPLLAQHVGLVTSSSGAAIRDILNVITRRFPNVHILLAPTRVQGEGAADEIAAAIDLLNKWGGMDVLIVGRGGGSLEDLWCFNEEVVARAIARSQVPVISAVGHEIDFTISDFVADLRAPTPSAAAELVVGRKEAFEEALHVAQGRFVRALRERVLEARNRLLEATRSPLMRDPRYIVTQNMQRIDGISLRVERAVSSAVQTGHVTIHDANMRSRLTVSLRLERMRQLTLRLDAQLQALSPLAVLGRGYSVTTNSSKHVLKTVGEVSRGERLVTRLADGMIDSEVLETRNKE